MKKCSKKDCNNRFYCRKLCRLHYSRYWNDKNREKTRKIQRNYYHNHKETIKEKRTSDLNYKYYTAKSHAKATCRTFNISKKTYIEILSKGCYYCGKPIVEYGCGLDRIDNEKGYYKNNVLPCCSRDNHIRSNRFTIEETKAMVLALEIHRSQNGTGK
jgi:hypothetical protein